MGDFDELMSSSYGNGSMLYTLLNSAFSEGKEFLYLIPVILKSYLGGNKLTDIYRIASCFVFSSRVIYNMCMKSALSLDH